MSEIPFSDSPVPGVAHGLGKDPTVSMQMDANESDRLAGEEALSSVYQQCINAGDFSLFETCPELRRLDIRAVGAFTICPEDLVNVNECDEGWKGYWLVEIPGASSLRERIALKQLGFYPANTNDGFRTTTYEVRADGFIHWDVLHLWVQRSRNYKAHQADRNIPASELLRVSREAFHEAVDRVSGGGIGSVEGESDEDGTIPQDALRSVVRAGSRATSY